MLRDVLESWRTSVSWSAGASVLLHAAVIAAFLLFSPDLTPIAVRRGEPIMIEFEDQSGSAPRGNPADRLRPSAADRRRGPGGGVPSPPPSASPLAPVPIEPARPLPPRSETPSRAPRASLPSTPNTAALEMTPPAPSPSARERAPIASRPLSQEPLRRKAEADVQAPLPKAPPRQLRSDGGSPSGRSADSPRAAQAPLPTGESQVPLAKAEPSVPSVSKESPGLGRAPEETSSGKTPEPARSRTPADVNAGSRPKGAMASVAGPEGSTPSPVSPPSTATTGREEGRSGSVGESMGPSAGSPDRTALVRDLNRGGGLRNGRVGIEGEPVPLDSKDPRYADYLKHIRRQIQEKWAYPREAAERELQGQLVVEIGIAKDGRIAYLDLRRSSGVRVLDVYAVNAVKLAQPFPPVPDRISLTGFPVTVVFNYILEIWRP